MPDYLSCILWRFSDYRTLVLCYVQNLIFREFLGIYVQNVFYINAMTAINIRTLLTGNPTYGTFFPAWHKYSQTL